MSGFGPSEPAAARCKQHLTLAQGRTRHPQSLQPPLRSRAFPPNFVYVSHVCTTYRTCIVHRAEVLEIFDPFCFWHFSTN